jgi:hypothetical protein
LEEISALHATATRPAKPMPAWNDVDRDKKERLNARTSPNKVLRFGVSPAFGIPLGIL